jgi:hypothetical protein
LAALDYHAFLLWIREVESISTHTSRIAVLIPVVEFCTPEIGREDAVWEELCDEAAHAAGGGVYGCIFEAAGLREEEVVDCCWGWWGVA